MSSGCTKVAVTMTILLLYLFISAETCSFIRTTGNWCVCLPGCPTSHMSTCLHMSAHVCTCLHMSAHAALQQHVQAMAADMPALMSSQGRGQHGAPAGGGTTHPPPFTHCLTSDQTWEPCLTMIGMERNRIIE